MDKTAAVILAAGKGTRMKSKLAKVLHPVAGKPMVEYPMGLARRAGLDPLIVVVGHQAESIEERYAEAGVRFARQEPQLGTGHAVMQALPALEGFDGRVVVMVSDAVLLSDETIARLLAEHRAAGAAISFISAVFPEIPRMGRVVRGPHGHPVRIVEDQDASEEEKRIAEINSAIYCIETPFLRESLSRLNADNAQGEYYLPDLVALAAQAGLGVHGMVVDDPQEIMGINNRAQLADMSAAIRRRRVEELMLAGVSVVDPHTTYVDEGVEVEPDTELWPNTFLLGATRVGAGCVIEEGVRITDSTIGAGTYIKSHCYITQSTVGEECEIGPFAQLRPESTLARRVKVGNFVETKNARLGEGTKANHLSYLGDTDTGADCNLGAGTITCNFDGRVIDGLRKHPHPHGRSSLRGQRHAAGGPYRHRR